MSNSLAARLAEALVEWQRQSGSTERATRLYDLQLYARTHPEFGTISRRTVIAAADGSSELELERVRFQQDGYQYGTEWLKNYSLDGVPSFDHLAHLRWLYHELPRQLPSTPRGLTMKEVNNLMVSQGVELAPGIPPRRRDTRAYIEEAIRWNAMLIVYDTQSNGPRVRGVSC